MFTLEYRGKNNHSCVYSLYIYVNSDGKGKVLKQFKLNRYYSYSAKNFIVLYMFNILNDAT